MFVDRKPDLELDALIARARNAPPMTDAEMKTQRDSFVRAEVGFGSDADEAEYARAITAGDAQAIAVCEAKSQQRMAALKEGRKGE